MSEQDSASPPGRPPANDVTGASATGMAGPAPETPPAGASDWRAAWRAARFSDDDASTNAGSGGPVTEVGARGSGNGWRPPVEPARAAPATASATATTASHRSATSTMEHRPDGKADDVAAASDAADPADPARPGFRALLTSSLAQARAKLEGRVDPDPSGPGGPAAGSISAPVAAIMAAASIPGLAARPSPTAAAVPPATPTPAVQSPTGHAPTVQKAPASPVPAPARAGSSVVIPSGVPAVVPAAVPTPVPVPVPTPTSGVPISAAAGAATAVAAAAGIATAGAGTTGAATGAISPTPPVPPGAAPRKPAPAPRRGGRLRRAHLKVTRIDPWTIMKISFLLSIAFGIMTIVAVAVVWSMLDAAGVFTSINETLTNVTGGTDSSSGGFDLLKWVALDRVLGVTTLIAVVDVVLITALSTLGAFLYNLGSALLGGVEVTLVEDQR